MIKPSVKKMGIKFDKWFSETTLYKNKEVDDTISELTKKGFTYESEGALWFKSKDLGDDSYSLIARFNSVTGLRVGNPVEILGIQIGKVEQITMDQKNQKAIVEIKINKGINIYDDAIASIKTEGLIGDKFLSIDPGGAGSLLGPRGTITETQAPVDIIELVSKYAFGEVKK